MGLTKGFKNIYWIHKKKALFINHNNVRKHYLHRDKYITLSWQFYSHFLKESPPIITDIFLRLIFRSKQDWWASIPFSPWCGENNIGFTVRRTWLYHKAALWRRTPLQFQYLGCYYEALQVFVKLIHIISMGNGLMWRWCNISESAQQKR